MASHYAKAATSPTDTTDFPAVTGVRVLPQLAQAAASMQLLALTKPLNIHGKQTTTVPYIGYNGLPVAPFVAEGGPIPVVDLLTKASKLGQRKKIAIATTLTEEMQQASGDVAEDLFDRALTASVTQTMDKMMLSSDAGTAIAPPGLLFGVTAIPSAAKTGAEGIAADLALIADKIGSYGIATNDMVLVTTNGMAEKINTLASPKLTHRVLATPAVPAGTLIGIIPAGFITGFDGTVSVDVFTHGTVHMEDTNPQDVGGSTTPVKSLDQTASLALRIRCFCTWTMQEGAIAQVTGADW